MDLVRNDEILFHEGDLDATLRAELEKVKETVSRLREDELLGTPLDDLVGRVADQHTVTPLELDVAAVEAETKECRIPINRVRDAAFRFPGARDGRAQTIDGQEVSFHVPFTGHSRLFKLRPNSYTMNPPRGTVRGSELVFTFQATSVGAHLKQACDHEIQEVERYVRAQGAMVDAHNKAVGAAAKRLLSERIGRVQQASSGAAALGVPLRRRADAPTTYVAPEIRRKLPAVAAPATTPKQAGSHAPEPTLPDGEYDHILKVMSNMAVVLERSPSAFASMDEEDIRSHFLVQLNGQYEGQATGETFNFGGKTDILVRSGGRNIFIAECKFWKGPKAFVSTIDQLLGYLTWRDTKAAIIVFNRDVQLSTILTAIPEALRTHPSCSAPVRVEKETTFATMLTRPDDPQRYIKLTVMVFDVPKLDVKDK